MNSDICKNCVHYRQHYILDEQRCASVNCGHCVYPRIKHREPHAKACSYYELRTMPNSLPDQDRVMHFLTTELLQYILSLDLPLDLK